MVVLAASSVGESAAIFPVHAKTNRRSQPSDKGETNNGGFHQPRLTGLQTQVTHLRHSLENMQPCLIVKILSILTFVLGFQMFDVTLSQGNLDPTVCTKVILLRH